MRGAERGHLPRRTRNTVGASLSRLSLARLKAFDADLARVSSMSPSVARTSAFIVAGTKIDRESTRQWYAGRAELALLAHLAECVHAADLFVEPALPNGRLADAAVVIGERRIWIECTALTTSNIALAAERPELSIQVGYGDPYGDTQRMYRKTFDKVVGVGESPKSQMHPTEPTVLVVVEGVLGAGFASEGTTWALQQMLDPSQRETSSRASFPNWIEHDYPNTGTDSVAYLDSLSAIALHGYDLRHRGFHINHAADSAHELTVAERAALVTLLAIERVWTDDAANV